MKNFLKSMAIFACTALLFGACSKEEPKSVEFSQYIPTFKTTYVALGYTDNQSSAVSVSTNASTVEIYWTIASTTGVSKVRAYYVKGGTTVDDDNLPTTYEDFSGTIKTTGGAITITGLEVATYDIYLASVDSCEAVTLNNTPLPVTTYGVATYKDTEVVASAGAADPEDGKLSVSFKVTDLPSGSDYSIAYSYGDKSDTIFGTGTSTSVDVTYSLGNIFKYTVSLYPTAPSDLDEARVIKYYDKEVEFTAPLPAAPTNVKIISFDVKNNGDGSQADISWSAPTTSFTTVAQYYVVAVADDEELEDSDVFTYTSTTSATLETLTAGKTYTFYVQSMSTDNKSTAIFSTAVASSNTITAYDNSLYTLPTVSSAACTSSNLSIAWDYNGSDLFELKCTIDDGKNWTVVDLDEMKMSLAGSYSTSVTYKYRAAYTTPKDSSGTVIAATAIALTSESAIVEVGD